MNKRKRKKQLKKIRLLGWDTSTTKDYSCRTYGHYRLDETIVVTDVIYSND